MTKEYIQPTEDEIRIQAYYLWEADGRPGGRDWEYWIKAKEQLTTLNSKTFADAPSSRKATPVTSTTDLSKKRTTSRSTVLA